MQRKTCHRTPRHDADDFAAVHESASGTQRRLLICIWAREQGNWFWRRKSYDARFRLPDVHVKLVRQRTADAKRADRVIAVFRKVHLGFDELRARMMEMMRRGAVKTTGDMRADLEATSKHAAITQPETETASLGSAT